MKKSIQVDNQTVRLSLREEKDLSILNINGSHILHLNPTATEYVKMVMDELTPEQAVKAIQKNYRVSKEEAKADYEKVFFSIATLATRKDVCPFSYLGMKDFNFSDLELSAPLRFDLAITYRCNNDCSHCYMGGSREMAEFSTDKWKKVIDIADDIGINSLTFTGGEPTLRDDLAELVDYNHDLVTGLVTNGRLMSKELVSTLENNELDHIQITVEGLEKTHDEMVCAKGAYKETMAGLRNSIDSSIFTLTNTTLTRKNCDEFPKLLELLHSYGLENFAVNSIIYSGKAKGADYGFTPQELIPILTNIQQQAIDYGMEMVWYTPTRRCELDPVEMGLGLKCCSAARINVTIEPDGNVIPCQSWFESMGNILTDDWDSIWNSKLARSIRDKEFMPDECHSCDKYDNCSAGCPIEDKGKGCSPLSQ